MVGAVISEWLGGFNGLGVYMTRVKQAFAFDKMFAVIFLISVISLLLMKLVDFIQNKMYAVGRMHMNHKKILAVGLAAVMTVGAAGSITVSAADNETEKITFVLDWTPNTNHTGLYVAESLGYFEDQGLEVEIVQPPEGGADALVASGRAQFGVSFQDSMAPGVAGDNALPTTAVAALIQHNTSRDHFP